MHITTDRNSLHPGLRMYKKVCAQMEAVLLAFFLNIAAGVAWDGVKHIILQKPDNSPERLAMEALTSTMQDF